MFCPGCAVAGPAFVTARSAGDAGVTPLMVSCNGARLLAGSGSTVVLVTMASLRTAPDGVCGDDWKLVWKSAEAPAARVGMVHCKEPGMFKPQDQPAGMEPPPPPPVSGGKKFTI